MIVQSKLKSSLPYINVTNLNSFNGGLYIVSASRLQKDNCRKAQA